jgi:tRNA pseudouridine38-40 synthase
MHTWKLEIEYDGSRYRGWQKQKYAKTVQNELEGAASEIFKTLNLEIGGSGRTDAGVHALAQVAHLRVRAPEIGDLTPRQIQFRLNDLLPHDINVLRVSNAAHTFHARHDAVSRYYLYQISTRRTAFAKNYVWWVKDRLDVAAMNHAAKLLVGRHDFRSFCEPKEDVSTIVVVQKSSFYTHDDLILFRIGASHFLWKMVRRLVGTLAEVGRGKYSIGDLEKSLKYQTNDSAALTAPPSGLFLEKVLYPGDAPPSENKPAFFNG